MVKRDTNAFRLRFERWKNGELVYDKGRPITDSEYIGIMEKVAADNNPKWNELRRNEGGRILSEELDLVRILNDNSYDYRGYYNKYPNSRANTDTHWTDEFKTAYHPSFSTYSKYSGKKSQYNPEGVLGGHWDGEKYIPAWGLKLPSYYKSYSTGKDEDTPTPPALTVKAGDKVNTTQCAAWSNGWLRKNGYLTRGNAWNLKNVDVLYNGYSNMEKPSKYDLKAILQYNHAAADSVYKNFDSSTLDKSKPYAVNMFYNGSPAQEEAYRNGDRVTGTHTGALVFNPSKNRWYVTHNIHGTIHQEPFVQLLSGKGKYGVTAIYQPRENTFVNKVKGLFGFKDGKDAGETMKEIVITPSANDKKLVSQMKQMIPEYDSRIKMYGYLTANKSEDNLGLSLNDQVGRLYDVYNRAKQPKIYNTRSFIVNKLGSLINKNDYKRANYNPITNAIHIPTYDEKHYSVLNLIPELAHAYQYYANDKNISTYNLRNIFSLPGDIKIGGKLGYDRPGNLEYSAHKIILPAIEDYLFGYWNNINIPYYVSQ